MWHRGFLHYVVLTCGIALAGRLNEFLWVSAWVETERGRRWQKKFWRPTKVDIEIKRKTKEPMMLHDGSGLYLQRARSGSVSWIFRFRSPVTGKSRDMGLGAARKTTLAEVRVEADRLRTLVKTAKTRSSSETRRVRVGRPFAKPSS